MRRLGAILAGGASLRFGSDKAAFPVKGRALLDHVAAALRPQVSDLIVVGRSWPGLARVDDQPRPGLGPLGGLCGALRHAQACGHDGVISAGCDAMPIPLDIFAGHAGAAIVDTQPLIGWWPVALAGRLEEWLTIAEDRSVYGWAKIVGAARLAPAATIHNLNTPGDVVRWEAEGMPGA